MDTSNLEKDYIGHRKRIKKRFLKSGLDSFSEYEVLELALTYSIPRKDTKPLAKKLIEKFKNLKSVLEANQTELQTVEGLTENSITFIKFLRSLILLYSYLEVKQKSLADSPQKVVDFLTTHLNAQSNEMVYSIFLDASNRVIECVKVEEGVANKAVLIPRKIAELALKFKCVSVIIAHNHPGGTLKPSKNDLASTDKVKDALNALDISLLDHIIIAGNSYYSFKENSLL